MSDEPVVIIGAGPAGLAAAWECIGRQLRPVVLEGSGMVGGIARTESYNDYLFDIGGHRFFSKIERVNRLWQEMLGPDLLRVPRLSRIYYQGKFFRYPLECVDALVKLGLLESLLIVVSYGRAQVRPSAVEETFEQWVSNRFGRRLYLTFFKTYTEKVWGIPCDEIRADWAAQRIKGLSLMVALANALFGNARSKSLIDAFDYPARGPGMMWQRFQEEIVAHGGTVRLQSEVIRVEHGKGLVSGVVLQEGGCLQTIAADHFISSVPITRLVQLLEPPPPAEVVVAARALSYRAFLIVGLIVKQADLFPDQWIYVHSPDVRVGRIQNFKNWSAAMVPDAYTTSIGMEYFCNTDDELWRMTDAELIALATAELAALGLAVPTDVTDGVVIRQPAAYPVYDRDYGQNLKTIKDYLTIFKNLQTIGRNGMHRYNNMDHSMQTGIMAVENIRGAAHDLWAVNDEEEYLEEGKAAGIGRSVLESILVQSFARMDKVAMATAIGSVCGLLVLAATLWISSRDPNPAASHLRLLAQYCIGYTVTVQGAFVGFAYFFFWGFLAGWLFAYLRNFFLAVYLFHLKKKSALLTVKDFFDHL
ncbi:MAG: hypothetical protein A2521_03215 [Deltaproteobacteria bacterium RIFOXYD12_FULL_57_12]|nr:MAG: hypothetical protein A2521_03215 [Deltaproteobacteria bacterium RIFOXYD12_FULL_57_12]